MLYKHFEHGVWKEIKHPLSVLTLLSELFAKMLGNTRNTEDTTYWRYNYLTFLLTISTLFFCQKCISRRNIISTVIFSPYYFDYYLFSSILLICNSTILSFHRTHWGHSHSLWVKCFIEDILFTKSFLKDKKSCTFRISIISHLPEEQAADWGSCPATYSGAG